MRSPCSSLFARLPCAKPKLTIKNHPKMIYAGVFRVKNPIAEHGNDQKARVFAKAIAAMANQTKFSYTSESMAGHGASRANGDLVLVVCDSSTPRRRAFALVEEIDSHINDSDDQRQIQTKLDSTVDGFDWNDPLSNAQADIDQVRTIMIENVDRVLERGERISLLVDRTQELSTGAHTFRKQAVSARNRIWWRNMYMMCLLVLFLALFVLVVYFFF